MSVLNFMNISIRAKSAEELARFILKNMDSNLGISVHFVAASTFNKYFLKLSFPNRNSSLWIADGKPLEAVLRIKYGKDFRGLRSIDFVTQIFQKSSVELPLKHFLIGSSFESAESFRDMISKNRCHNVAGILIAPFKNRFNEHYQEWLDQINDSEADIVWITLGSPKQDVIAYELSQISSRCFIAIGAGLDFYTGIRKPAPNWLRILYMEWFYRLIQEPRRLWKRYLFGNLRFLIITFSFLLKKKSN